MTEWSIVAACKAVGYTPVGSNPTLCYFSFPENIY